MSIYLSCPLCAPKQTAGRSLCLLRSILHHIEDIIGAPALRHAVLLRQSQMSAYPFHGLWICGR